MNIYLLKTYWDNNKNPGRKHRGEKIKKPLTQKSSHFAIWAREYKGPSGTSYKRVFMILL